MTTLGNLVIYSLQLGALTAAALLVVSVLRLRAPKFALRFWQLVVLGALLLPALQPRSADGGGFVFTTSISEGVIFNAPREAFAARLGVDVVTLIGAAIALGIGFRMLWLAMGLWRVRSLVANATREASLSKLGDELNHSFGTRAEVVISDELPGPATIGIRRPVVLVPRAVIGMSPAVQRAIVSHELLHVRRRDWLHTLAEEAWCAVLWFHPAARVIASRLSIARETVVDELTILFTRDRRAYAEALLAFSDPQPHVIGVTPFIGRRTLSQRIALLAQETPMSHRRAFASFILALFASAGLTATVVDRVPMSAPAQTRTVYRPGNGVTLPQVVKEVKPTYTAAAMQAKIQGSVWLECVVDENGDLADIKVTRSLDEEHGLDKQAIAAAQQWKFQPAQKGGKPVAVAITIEMTFTLKK